MTYNFKNAQSAVEHINTMNSDYVIPAPIELVKLKVQSDWIDYNGHMNESMYLFVASLGYEGLMKLIGINEEWTQKYGSYFTVENHNTYFLECKEGEELTVKNQLVDYDPKKIHIANMIYRGDDLIFISENMSLYVNPISRKVEPAPDEILQRMEKIAQAHKDLSKQNISKSIGIRKK